MSVRDVSKRFRLYHERPSSLKERLVSLRKPRYEVFWALSDVSLDIASGETIGVIGPNGSGKSTLLKCVAGVLRPDCGTILAEGRMASLLELGAGFHPDLTGRENVYLNAAILGLTRRETDRQFDAIVGFSELGEFIDMQVKHYSSGMYVRLGFAVAVHVDPEILLVDEVLAVGDEAFQNKCLDRIRQFQRDGRSIVFVTHAVDQVRQLCTRAAFLDHGRLVQAGAPNDVIRTFRQVLHGEAHLEAAPFEERGTREIRIVSVTIRDGEGHERRVFSPGEDLEVTIDLQADRPVDDPIVGCAIYDEFDRLAFGTNTEIAGVELGTLAGKTRIRFLFRQVPMLHASVSITIGVHSRDHRTPYHWQEKAYPFRYVAPGPEVGAVRVTTEIVVEAL